MKKFISLLLVIATVASCATCINAFRIKPDSIIAAAEIQANSMINNANANADAIIVDAESEASSIIDKAEKEKAKKIAEAKAKAEEEAKKKKLSSPFVMSFPIKLSDSDRDLLYRICNAESGSYGKKAIQAVCWVILNRLASNRFPNTMHGVVYQKHLGEDGWVWQFTPCQNGAINKKPTNLVKEAVDEVLAGKVSDPTGGATYFCTPAAAAADSWWGTLEFTYHINGHNFYRP